MDKTSPKVCNAIPKYFNAPPIIDRLACNIATKPFNNSFKPPKKSINEFITPPIVPVLASFVLRPFAKSFIPLDILSKNDFKLSIIPFPVNLILISFNNLGINTKIFIKDTTICNKDAKIGNILLINFGNSVKKFLIDSPTEDISPPSKSVVTAVIISAIKATILIAIPDTKPTIYAAISATLSKTGKIYWAIDPANFKTAFVKTVTNVNKLLVIFIKFSSVPPPSFNPLKNSLINSTSFPIGSKFDMIL